MLPAAPIQTAHNSHASGTSLVVTIAKPQIGNILFLIDGNNTGTPSLVATTGVTWTGFQLGGSVFALSLYVGTAITSSAGTTVTITTTTGNDAALVMEWPGLLLPTCSDQKNVATGTSTSISSGSITPSQPNELLIAAGLCQGATPGAPSGAFTAATGSPVVGGTIELSVAYLLQGAAAAASTTWAVASTGWDGLCTSFKAQPNPYSNPLLPLMGF